VMQICFAPNPPQHSSPLLSVHGECGDTQDEGGGGGVGCLLLELPCTRPPTAQHSSPLAPIQWVSWVMPGRGVGGCGSVGQGGVEVGARGGEQGYVVLKLPCTRPSRAQQPTGHTYIG
jgi:hypothetical protein